MTLRPRGRDLLRAAVTAAGALVIVWWMARPAGLVAACVGAAAGSLLASALGGTRLRTWPAVLGALVVGLAGQGAAVVVVGSEALATISGPLAARALGDALLWGSAMLCGAFALRLGATRLGWMAAVEAAVLAASLAASLAPHRGGMVHRPLALADWAIARGTDPVAVLLLLGAAASIFLALLLLGDPVGPAARGDASSERSDAREERRRRRHRLSLNVAAVAAVVLLLLLGLWRWGVPQPRAAADLGLTGQPRDDASPAPAPSGAPRSPGSGEPSPSGGEDDQTIGPDRAPRPDGSSPRPGQGPARQGDAEGDLPFRKEYSSAGGEAPVAVVLLRDDYTPPSGVFYFRQSVFSHYNGIRLVEATGGGVDEDVPDRFPSRRIDVAPQPPESAGRRDLQTTVGLIADHVRPFALDALGTLWPTENPDRLRFRRSYEAISRVPTLSYQSMLGRRSGLPGWSEAERTHYTEWPRQDARYKELAERILATLPEKHRADPLARAVAVKTWLDQNGIYSRKSQHAEGPDPTASFLFGDMTGYCVHFAHAAAFLLRALDVPTRVAGGYAVAEGRRAGGSALMIRGLDGHAWPEIALEGVGWVVVDPSPERTLETEGSEPDPALQRMLGESLRKGAGAPPPTRATRWPTIREIGRILLSIAALLAAGAAAVKAWRALAPAFAPAAEMYRVGYRAALDRLSEVGYRRRRGESREAFAARVAALSPSFARLTARHLGAALGSRRPSPPAEMRTLASLVAREVRRGLPGWRVVLGTLNPFSYILTR